MTEPRIDLATNTVSAGQASVRVPPTIAELIVVLMKAAPGYVDMERLQAALYGLWAQPVADTTVRVHLSRTNKALRQIGFRIENARYLGWRLVKGGAVKPPVPFEVYAAVVAERDAALEELRRANGKRISAVNGDKVQGVG